MIDDVCASCFYHSFFHSSDVTLFIIILSSQDRAKAQRMSHMAQRPANRAGRAGKCRYKIECIFILSFDLLVWCVFFPSFAFVVFSSPRPSLHR